MKNIIQLLRFVLNHDANKGKRFAAFRDLLKWQIGSRLVPGDVVFNWLEETKLIVANGEAGLTGNVYTGLHEFADMAFLLHFLRPEDTFFDIGANRGAYTVLASGVCGAKTVAFEPVPGTFAKLEANIRVNQLEKLATARNSGLGDKEGELWVSASLDSANHIVPEHSKVEKIRVPVRRLDDATTEIPALIKIDVEGFEMNVFSGAAGVLSNSMLKCLIVEVNDAGKRYGFQATDILDHLGKFGFDPYLYHPIERRLEPTTVGLSPNGNTLFLRDLEHVRSRVETAKKVAVRSLHV
ncbi:methyltransferase FkbM family [Rhodopirellula baltica SWK14]|uniref:Methyltransferase FkbM family n=1 Tax=Rhodopirellula baltica SWK14 TaxID=993516 RepID=L7CK88_RHOBT|nr:methyltransferase FkbM family [Rhodopirellula baltica SWK14]